MSALVFACYERACRPPTSGGTGGSSKRTAGVPYKTKNGWAVLTETGKTIKGTFSQTHPPYDPDPSSDIDNIWDGAMQDALRGAAQAYDAAPVDIVPKVVLGDFSKNTMLLNSYQTMIDKKLKEGRVIMEPGPNGDVPITAERLGQRVNGLIMSQTVAGAPFPKGVIGINASARQYAQQLEGKSGQPDAMPESNTVPIATYTAIHEYGHHRFYNGPDQVGVWRTRTLYEKYKQDPEMSDYGRTSPTESHAEAFAAWVLGKPPRKIALDYQDEYGWGEADADTRNPSAMDKLTFVLTEAPDADEIAVILDTEDGPVYVLKTGEVVSILVKG